MHQTSSTDWGPSGSDHSRSVQLKRELAQMSYAQQLEAVKPTAPRQSMGGSIVVQQQDDDEGDSDSEKVIAQAQQQLQDKERDKVLDKLRAATNEELEARALRRMANELPDLTGLAALASLETFASSMAQVGAKWPGLTVDERADNTLEAANRALAGVDSHPLLDLESKTMAPRAQFSSTLWLMRLREDRLKADSLDPTVVNSVAHEARHSEQYFRIFRLLAGRGLEADEINEALPFSPPDAVIDAAVAKPLPDAVGDKVVDEAKSWEKAFLSEEGRELKKDVVGDLYAADGDVKTEWKIASDMLALYEEEPTEAHREWLDESLQSLDQAIERFGRAYGKYRELIHEKDAHEVGVTAQTVFNALPDSGGD